MSRLLRRPVPAVVLLSALVSFSVAGAARAGLVISPSSIEHNYVGAVDLAITGLDTLGQSVVIEEFYDADGNGTIGGADFLVRKFTVTDGAVTSIAGQRNLNIPGDEDGLANLQIQTRLIYVSSDSVGRSPGQYIFRVSPAGGSGFAPFTAILVVNQHNYGGSGISGQVVGGGPVVGQAGSLVVFFSAAGTDKEAVGIAYAGASGNYNLNLPAGSYQALGAKAGFVFDTSAAPTITVAPATVSTNQTVTLSASQRTITGKVRDSATLAGLPGIVLQGGATMNGFITITFADGNGSYSMDATADPWEIHCDQAGIAHLDYLSISSIESSTVSVTGFNLGLTAATSLIFGTIKTPAGVPIPFLDIPGQANGSPSYQTDSFSLANGNYSLGVIPGSWRIGPQVAGYLVESIGGVVVTNDATAVPQDLIAHPITTHLRGQVVDNLGQPVPNLSILVRDPTLQGGNEISSLGTSDSSGNFDIGLYGGVGGASKTWSLQVFITKHAPQNYVGTSPNFAVIDGVDQNGIVYLVYRVTAHLRGQVQDENNAPIGNINIFANTGTTNINTGTNVDGGGNFDIPLFGGNWQLGLSNITGLGLIPQNYPITVADNADQNGLIFRALHVSTTIAGSVKSTTNIPIGGVTLTGSASTGGNSYTSYGTTDGVGNYSIPVFSGTWSAIPDSGVLAGQGYQSVASQNAFVSSSLVTLNFVAAQSFSGWLNQNFTPAEEANPNISGPLADPDGDGIVNLVEFALHLDPKLADAQNLPRAGTIPASGVVTLTYRRLVGATSVQYIVQESTSLTGGFGPASVTSETILSNDGTVQTVRADVPMGALGTKFLRLNIISSGQ